MRQAIILTSRQMELNVHAGSFTNANTEYSWSLKIGGNLRGAWAIKEIEGGSEGALLHFSSINSNAGFIALKHPTVKINTCDYEHLLVDLFYDFFFQLSSLFCSAYKYVGSLLAAVSSDKCEEVQTFPFVASPSIRGLLTFAPIPTVNYFLS